MWFLLWLTSEKEYSDKDYYKKIKRINQQKYQFKLNILPNHPENKIIIKSNSKL
jgi:hypothetical protein